MDALSMGTSVSDTTREARREKVTVRAMSLKSCPAIPSTKTMGKNTATVVNVEAVTAPATSVVPFMAESKAFTPFSRYRWMASRTTMELSTSMPIPRASPPSEMMFREILAENIRKNVMITETGMAVPMIRVLLAFFRK